MNREVIEFNISENSSIFVEIPEYADGRVERVSRMGDSLRKSTAQVKKSIDESLDGISNFGNKIYSKIKAAKVAPNEVEVQFGVKLSAEAGIVITNIAGEAHVNIIMKWKEEES